MPIICLWFVYKVSTVFILFPTQIFHIETSGNLEVSKDNYETDSVIEEVSRNVKIPRHSFSLPLDQSADEVFYLGLTSLVAEGARLSICIDFWHWYEARPFVVLVIVLGHLCFVVYLPVSWVTKETKYLQLIHLPKTLKRYQNNHGCPKSGKSGRKIRNT